MTAAGSRGSPWALSGVFFVVLSNAMPKSASTLLSYHTAGLIAAASGGALASAPC
jgi:hypothetical protein